MPSFAFISIVRYSYFTIMKKLSIGTRKTLKKPRYNACFTNCLKKRCTLFVPYTLYLTTFFRALNIAQKVFLCKFSQAKSNPTWLGVAFKKGDKIIKNLNAISIKYGSLCYCFRNVYSGIEHSHNNAVCICKRN